jgi:hypothetical protein
MHYFNKTKTEKIAAILTEERKKNSPISNYLV